MLFAPRLLKGVGLQAVSNTLRQIRLTLDDARPPPDVPCRAVLVSSAHHIHRLRNEYAIVSDECFLSKIAA